MKGKCGDLQCGCMCWFVKREKKKSPSLFRCLDDNAPSTNSAATIATTREKPCNDEDHR